MPVSIDDGSIQAPLRLGNIVYSNCFPVHARLIDRPRRGDPVLVEGVPSVLNAQLRAGGIDVAPSSSIEFARNAEQYKILPDLVIGSRGPVRSIVFVSDRAPKELDRQLVALPTASATSVVLLKILLRTRWKVEPRFQWFDQAHDDPFATGAAAALYIGDVALRHALRTDKPVRLDLGSEWWDETSLPFAFAVWQVGSGDRAAVSDLHSRLLESRAFGHDERTRLATAYARHFGMDAGVLEQYWNDLSYDLDDPMIEGLRAFYALAAEIGELDRVPELKWA